MVSKSSDDYRVFFFDTFSQAILIVDENLVIIDANNAAQNLFTSETKELVGIGLDRIYSPLQSAALKTEIISLAIHAKKEIIVKGYHQNRLIDHRMLLNKVSDKVSLLCIEPDEQSVLSEADIDFHSGRGEHPDSNDKKWLVEMDKTMLIVSSTEQAAGILGYTAEEIIGKSPFSLIPELIEDRVKKQVYHYIFLERKPFSFQVPHITHQGNLKLLQISAEPVYDKWGDFEILRGHVTEASEEISNSDIMEQTFDSAGIGMAMISLDDRFVLVNKALCKMVGYTKEELLSCQYRLVHPDDWKATKRNIQLLLNDEITNSFMEKRLVAKDGSIVWISQNTTLISNSSGTPWLVFVQMQDITESIRIREQLKEANHRAESNDRLKSALLYNINHEFRTPLNGMIGLSQLIADNNSDPDLKEMALNITNCSRRLSYVLESMILLSQLASHNVKINLQPFNLKELIDKVTTNLFTRIQANAIKLDVQVDGNVWITSDYYLLEKALHQVLDNSVKFSGSNSRIRVSTLTGSVNNSGTVVIEICDEGTGISEEYLKELYTSFTQEDSGINRTYEGLGIGLSIVKKVMDCLDARIDIKSRKNVGTSVLITLSGADFVSATDREKLRAKIHQNLVSADPEPHKKKSILIIEDNIINAKLMTTYLANLYEVTHVLTGEEAVEKCSQSRFHLILTDIHLGKGINGIEAAKQILQLKNYRNVPIVAVSGYFDSEKNPVFSKEDCFTEMLGKPFDAEALRSLIDKALHK